MTLRVAAVFDRTDASGRPWFSPFRRRVVDRAERERLADYLRGAPLALRAAGFEVDPRDPGRGPVVPLGYRTDGEWVWQEASGYYLLTYGVAPEDALLAHIEQHDHTPPAQLPDDVRNAAADAALTGESGEASRQPEVRYFVDVANRPMDRPGGLFRQWRNADGYWVDEAMHRDMRWHHTGIFVESARGGGQELVPYSEEQAGAVLDRWWRDWSGSGG